MIKNADLVLQKIGIDGKILVWEILQRIEKRLLNII